MMEILFFIFVMIGVLIIEAGFLLLTYCFLPLFLVFLGVFVIVDTGLIYYLEVDGKKIIEEEEDE